MAVSLQKVRRGDPLVIPAQTFNAFIDAARDHQHRQRSARRQAQRELHDSGIVLIRNESGADRERFDVLGIDGPIIAAVDNADEFKQRVALRGSIPSVSHAGKFAILLEPARDGVIARACVDGVCVARVRMLDEAHTSAEVSVGVASELESGGSGTARLLWIEPVTDRQNPQIAWCVIRIGGGGSGGPATATFAIITAKAGSSAPYRYTASGATMDIDGNWTDTGAPTYANVFNIEEQGSGAPFTPGLVDGDVVLLFQPTPNIDAYACIRTQYRGTY